MTIYLSRFDENTSNFLNFHLRDMFVCLFVCLSGRPPKGEVGVPWHLKPGIRPHVQGLAFSNAPFPGQAWGTNLVLLPYAGGT